MTGERKQFITSAEQAYEIICAKIISGELKPGEKLTRRQMASVTGLSVIPVIEALHRLEGEGLVISEPHFGSRVIDLDEKMIIDRFALRMAIECQVIRNLTIKHNPRDIEQLRMLAKNLDLYKRDEDDQDEFWKYHFDFHIKLAQLSRVDSFVAELKRLNLFDILRRTIVTYTKVKGKEVPERHHEKLIEAIESGDRELAEATMREHINFSGLVREEQF